MYDRINELITQANLEVIVGEVNDLDSLYFVANYLEIDIETVDLVLAVEKALEELEPVDAKKHILAYSKNNNGTLKSFNTMMFNLRLPSATMDRKLFADTYLIVGTDYDVIYARLSNMGKLFREVSKFARELVMGVK